MRHVSLYKLWIVCGLLLWFSLPAIGQDVENKRKPRVLVFDVIPHPSLKQLLAQREAITNILMSSLDEWTEVSLIDLAARDALFKQRKMNKADCDKQECRYAMVRGIGVADEMLEPTILPLGTACVVTLKRQNVRTGIASTKTREKVACDAANVTAAFKSLALELTGKAPAPGAQTPAVMQISPASLPEISPLSSDAQMPSGQGAVQLNVNEDVLVAYDVALKADESGKEKPNEAVKAWKSLAAFKKGNPYQQMAAKRLKEWTVYAKSWNERNDRRKADWTRLIKVLPLSTVDVSQKISLVRSFTTAYGRVPAGDMDHIPADYRWVAWTPMVDIPAGKYWTGCLEKDKCESESSTRAFRIDSYEVTAAEYQICADTKACSQPVIAARGTGMDKYCTAGDESKRNLPMNCVDRTEAHAYCQWLGKRLPTGGEWEKAARGDTDKRQYPWGDAWADCEKNGACSYLKPVGAYEGSRSPFGVYDMGGNVSEWTGDSSMRGGSFMPYYNDDRKISKRHALDPTERDALVGFRCVREIKDAGEPAQVTRVTPPPPVPLKGAILVFPINLKGAADLKNPGTYASAITEALAAVDGLTVVDSSILEKHAGSSLEKLKAEADQRTASPEERWQFIAKAARTPLYMHGAIMKKDRDCRVFLMVKRTADNEIIRNVSVTTYCDDNKPLKNLLIKQLQDPQVGK